MMASEKTGGLLTHLFTQGLSGKRYDTVLKAVLKLKPHSEETVLSCPLEEASAALKRCGALFPEDTEPGEVVGFVMAGIGDRNPAVIELCPEGGALRVRATAKEGLIPQGTSRKALEKLQGAL